VGAEEQDLVETGDVADDVLLSPGKSLLRKLVCIRGLSLLCELGQAVVGIDGDVFTVLRKLDKNRVGLFAQIYVFGVSEDLFIHFLVFFLQPL
jgi:hypothetical protein